MFPQHPGVADVGYGHGHSSGRPAFQGYTLHRYFSSPFLHTEQHVHTHTHTHIPQRPNQPSPPPLSLWVFLCHLILAVCMWIIHHSLNQSIEFHLVRCYPGHVIDSLVPFHWSLNDTQCCLGDVRARPDARLRAYIACALIPCCAGSPLPGGESWVPTLPKETPFEIVSRSPCPAGCANICSEWPKDWHERGESTLLDLGSHT